MANVLQQIVEHKKIEVAARKAKRPLQSFQQTLTVSNRSFIKALSNDHADFILECKKASPSKGLIREDFNLAEILAQYKDYASAISVLTDNHYFQGDFKFLTEASQTVSQPILCKDFFIDPYQVYEARYYGADAILLMLSVLDDEQYQTLAALAESLQLDVLTEVHDQSECERAIKLNAKVIGINNRNLKDLSIDLANTEKLAKMIPSDRIIISESGISTHQDVKRLSPLVSGFLVGSSIMQQQDIRLHCKKLIFGNVKICGITSQQDAQLADDCGASYIGFIFYPQSKRYITLEQAEAITRNTNVACVGVFVDQDCAVVIEHAVKLKLDVVQLHGNESADYINNLRLQLETTLPNCKIWQAFAVTDNNDINLNDKPNTNIDHYLLDSFSETEHGGTGKTFDWSILNQVKDHIALEQLILAGGINASNVKKAQQQNTYAIDLSSGVEVSPGIKCPNKMKQLFQLLR